MRVQNNLPAINSHRVLGVTGVTLAKSMEKLSSGLRINRAGDDAAGLAISEKMRGQVRGIRMASKNALDGISLIQTAEGAMHEVHSILQRQREIAVQAANGTNTDEDREALDKEFKQLLTEIDRISNTTEFNTKKLLNGTTMVRTAGIGGTKPEGASNNLSSVTLGALGAVNLTAFSEDLQNTMVPKAVDAIMNTFTSLNWFENINIGLGLQYGDYGAGGAAHVSGGMIGGDLWMSLRFNTNYLEGILDTNGNFINNDAKRAFENVIAHEMMHAAMNAAVYNLMSDSNNSNIMWFIEGMAQAASGHGGWLNSPAFGTNANINSHPYGEGYAATMYLGYIVGGSISADGSPIHPDYNPNATRTGPQYASEGIMLQVGANSGQTLTFNIGSMSVRGLGLTGVSIATQDAALHAGLVAEKLAPPPAQRTAIDYVDEAMKRVSSQRSKLGALQNRLEHTVKNLDVAAENLQAAESRIRDIDMAKEVMENTKTNILQQASQAMLAQANSSQQSILQLLR